MDKFILPCPKKKKEKKLKIIREIGFERNQRKPTK